MESNNSFKKIREEKEKWERNTLKPALERFKLKQAPTAFYTPLDAGEEFNFLGKSVSPASSPSPPGLFQLFHTGRGKEVRGPSPRLRGWSGPAATPATAPPRTPGITTCT